ncbi:MAG: MBOAT family protein [Clostridia bacterium]|nr:MBOAT family protein [Clostridia bacterium]
MLFQSWQYLLLLIATLLCVATIKNATVKRVCILVSSIFFYAYGAAWQTILFLAVIFGAYVAGRLFEKNKSKILFAIILFILFLPLLLYKYVPFILSLIPLVNEQAYMDVFLLPIGISFYTFQAVGYVIDVYKSSYKAERSLLSFACFISFFPQLVAGPIERYDNLFEQIREMKKPDYSMMSKGFRHIILGLCLKLLIAETMAGFVNPVYNNLNGKSGFAVIVATICFGIQIYCDFNGYTQIAIGSANILGINLMQNFNHPYKATSISDFWRRWHISLTTWFRDYLYIPLGGNRKGKFRTFLNSIITFLVSGIWHGANWTFALWGLFNGVGMATEKLYIKHITKNRFTKAFYAVVVFVCINLFWVFFRANSVEDAFLCYKLIFTQTFSSFSSLTSGYDIINFLLYENGWNVNSFIPAFISLFIYIWYEYGFGKKNNLTSCLNSQKIYVRWITYAVIILVTLYFGTTLQQSDFVYFRF